MSYNLSNVHNNLVLSFPAKSQRTAFLDLLPKLIPLQDKTGGTIGMVGVDEKIWLSVSVLASTVSTNGGWFIVDLVGKNNLKPLPNYFKQKIISNIAIMPRKRTKALAEWPCSEDEVSAGFQVFIDPTSWIEL